MTKNALDSLITELDKAFTPAGAEKPVIQRGLDRPDDRFIPCHSPAVEFVLATGGWIEGKLHEFFGKEHSGKTSLMLLSLKDVYEFYHGERPIAIIDIEHRYNEAWARKLGLPVDGLIVVQPTDAESATDIMQKLIQPNRKKPELKGVCAIGFDSIGGAASWKEHELNEDKPHVMASIAGPMSRNVKTMAPLANLFNCTLFYANQLRADMEGFNRPETPGGKAVRHMMSVRLYLRPGKQKWMDKLPDGSEVQVGQEVLFKTVKNSFGPPYREGYSNFFFHPSRYQSTVGFDIEGDVQTLGLATGIIKRGGPYYSYGDVKALGRDAFFESVKAGGFYDKLLAEIRAHLDEKRTNMATEEYVPIPADNIEIDDPEV